MNSSAQPTTTFLDLCAAGTPLAAVASCLLESSTSSRDVLHLGQAVGKQYRQRVLSQIRGLPCLKLQLDGVPARDVRAAARLLLQLDNVQHVSAAKDGDGEHRLCDPEGLMLLRLLPPLTFRRLQLDALYLDRDPEGVCRALTTLTTLKELRIGLLCEEGELDADSNNSMQVAAGYLAFLTQLTHLDMRGFMLTTAGIQHLAGEVCNSELLGSSSWLYIVSYTALSCNGSYDGLQQRQQQLLSACLTGCISSMWPYMHSHPQLVHSTPALLSTTGCDIFQLLNQVTHQSFPFSFSLLAIELMYLCYAATGLSALRELDLGDYNDLCGASLAPLSALTNLTKFCADEAYCDDDTLHHIGTWTGLRNLDLSAMNEEFGTTCYRHLSGLNLLTELRLRCNTLTADSMAVVARIRSLEVLNIEGADVEESCLAPLSMLSRLQTLGCCYIGVGPAAALHISKCRQLRSLDVRANDLGPEGAQHLAALTRLQNLAIAGKAIGAVGAAHIANSLTALTSLDVFQNVLGAAGAAHIARMTQLRKLEIMYNGLDGTSMQLLMNHLRHLTCSEPYSSLEEQALWQPPWSAFGMWR